MGGRRVILDVVPITEYTIGYCIVVDEKDEDQPIGKIVFSGTLNNITATFESNFEFLYSDAHCVIVRVTARFNLEQDDWHGHLVNYASNFNIVNFSSIPVLRSLSEEIGYIYLSGNCNSIKAQFKSSSELNSQQLFGITIKSRLSTKKPRKKRVTRKPIIIIN